jgi:hypothetical protein
MFIRREMIHKVGLALTRESASLSGGFVVPRAGHAVGRRHDEEMSMSKYEELLVK